MDVELLFNSATGQPDLINRKIQTIHGEIKKSSSSEVQNLQDSEITNFLRICMKDIIIAAASANQVLNIIPLMKSL